MLDVSLTVCSLYHYYTLFLITGEDVELSLAVWFADSIEINGDRYRYRHVHGQRCLGSLNLTSDFRKMFIKKFVLGIASANSCPNINFT